MPGYTWPCCPLGGLPWQERQRRRNADSSYRLLVLLPVMDAATARAEASQGQPEVGVHRSTWP